MVKHCANTSIHVCDCYGEEASEQRLKCAHRIDAEMYSNNNSTTNHGDPISSHTGAGAPPPGSTRTTTTTADEDEDADVEEPPAFR